MRVAVVGAGIVGVCTAWSLRQRGFEVTVFERRGGVAQEASFGNAGVIAPGYVTPWASPGMPTKVLRYLLKAESPVLFRPNLDPALWRWLARWLGECRLERYRVNKGRSQRVAFYSREKLHALRERLAIAYEQSQGYLQLLRSQRDVDMIAPSRAMLDDSGVPYRMLDADECRALEPDLSPATPLAGGLYLPDDEAGNCPLFAQALRRAAEDEGVNFRFDCPVTRLEVQGGAVAGVLAHRAALAKAAPSSEAFDAVVLAAAMDSARLLAGVGVRIPLYPVKGYSATVPLGPAGIGPRRALMDEAYKTAIVPWGNRLRIAGTAELGDHRLELRPAALRTLVKVASDWFPGAARYSDAQFWVGARPMLPDGPPLLGATPVRGVYLNVGHGSSGWAMACGCAEAVADVVAGRPPEISLDGLTLERYR